MLLPWLAIGVGLVLLVASAARFVEGAAAAARHFGTPPLLIGMVVIGFGTSAPELLVSGISAAQGNPGIALGNAYGSNITNIGLILGLAALLRPIAFRSRVLRSELPILTAVTALAVFQLRDLELSRIDAGVLLGVFAVLLGWSLRVGLRTPTSDYGAAVDDAVRARSLSLRAALVRLSTGLVVLIVSARALVWGAVEIARALGVDELVIGLTVVAIGTSLPELAAALAAARQKEHELALGNVLGSNLFNTLAVVGIAGLIAPTTVGADVLRRDALVMGLFTVSLFLIGYGFRAGRGGRINRVEGAAMVAAYFGYLAVLVATTVGASD